MEIKYFYLILIIIEIFFICILILYGMKIIDIVLCNVNYKIINESNIVFFFYKIVFFFYIKKYKKLLIV